jgi:TolA-binding protein
VTGPGTGGCPDDRVALLRRGLDGGAEWRSFAAHARACGDCKAAWLAARSFDDSGRTEPQDEELVHRAVHAALKSRAVALPRRRMPRWATATIASTAVVAAVGAGVFLRGATRSPPPVALVSPPSDVDDLAAALDRARPELVIPPEQPPADAPVATPRPRRTAAAADSPAALFARATAARGAGRRAEAIVLFQRLEHEFPGSPEAIVSLVSVGELLADTGAPEPALASFDAYLQRQPGGPLVPEALAARARLLERLGRADDARATRRELQRKIPDWPYVTRSGGSP